MSIKLPIIIAGAVLATGTTIAATTNHKDATMPEITPDPIAVEATQTPLPTNPVTPQATPIPAPGGITVGGNVVAPTPAPTPTPSPKPSPKPTERPLETTQFGGETTTAPSNYQAGPVLDGPPRAN